jgi:hypothetical protein
MNKLYRPLTLVLTLAAGFTGGLLSRYIAPERVFAQAPKEATQQVRASSFVLLDEAGRTAGVFAIEKKDGLPNIVLFNVQGKPIWDARHTVLVPLTQN